MERTETTEEKLTPPSAEVLERPVRRRFTAQYKLRILAQVDRCTEMGQVGELLRREGLYSSLLSTWRKQRDEGGLSLLSRKRGRKAKRGPEAVEIERLTREVTRLRERERQLELIVAAQKKVAALEQALEEETNE